MQINSHLSTKPTVIEEGLMQRRKSVLWSDEPNVLRNCGHHALTGQKGKGPSGLFQAQNSKASIYDHVGID